MAKTLTTSQINEKLDKLQFVYQKKTQEILEAKNLLKTCKDYEKPALEYSLNSFTEEYNSILERMSELKSQRKDLEKKEIPSIGFHGFTYQEFSSMPEKTWLVDQVFGSGDVGMIYGAPGCGKTFVVIDMIIQMCRGMTWAHRFKVNRPLNVAYCAGEGISALPERFRASMNFYEVDDLQNFTFFKTMPQLTSGCGDGESVIRFISEWKDRQLKKESQPLDVLVIDTLHTATCGVDENSSQEMGEVIKACRMATENLGCSVILVHHTNKGGTAERGSSALRGAMDFMLRIERIETGVTTNATLFCSKMKDGEQWQDQGFHLEKVDGTKSVRVFWNNHQQIDVYTTDKSKLKQMIFSEINKKPGFKFTSSYLSQIFGEKNSYVIKALSALVAEGKCKCKLSDDEKQSSRHNPLVYFVDIIP